MDVIDTDMPFDNLNVSAQTHLTQHVTRPFRNVTTQHLVAIFCHPHEVVLDVVDRMAPLSYSGMGQPRHRHSGESYSRFRAKAIRLNEVWQYPVFMNTKVVSEIEFQRPLD